MGKFLLLAFRNVFRNRRRTIMTLFMVSGGVAGLLLAGGYFAHMINGLREDTISNGLGHIQIFTTEHFRRDEVHVLDTGIDNWQRVAATVKTVSHVRGVAPRIEFMAWSPTAKNPPSSWAAPSIPTLKGAWGSLRMFLRATISTAVQEARSKPSSAPVSPSR